MRKYLEMLVYEFKNLIRDTMTVILLVYPLMIIMIGSFVLPRLIELYGDDPAGQTTAALVIIIIFSTIAPFVTAALLGFSLIDHRDENTLDTIRVTPLSLRGYIVFKSIYAYLLSVNASFWALYGVKLLSGDGYTFGGMDLWEPFTLGGVLVYALVASLFTPLFALFLAAMSKNKIEGFAYMKTMGLFTILPAVLVLPTMQDFKQYIIGILPTFWATKGLMVHAGYLSHDHNLTVSLYMLIGIVYSLLLSLLSYRFFEKRVEG